MTERKNSDLIPTADEAGKTEPNNKVLDFLKFEHLTLFVDLPSEGEVYPKESPLSKGVIEISQMLAPHEEILSNKTYIKNGVMFDKLVNSLLVDNSVTSEALISGDKTAILIAARRDAYGPLYKVNFICSNCGKVYEDLISLDEDIISSKGESDDDNCTRDGMIISIAELPKSRVSLKFQLLTGKEDKRLFDYNRELQRNGEEVGTLDQYRLIFKEVNGITDQGVINQFINVMPARDSKYVKRAYKMLAPDAKLIKNSMCTLCGALGKKEAVFNTEFFWPSDE
jgi:hypothetical protein